MKHVFTVLAGLGLLFFFGCSSYDPFADLSLIDPMAVVRVSADTDITWYNESNDKFGGSLLGAVANAVVNDAKDEKVSTLLSRADLLVEQADKALLASLREVGTIGILDKEALLATGAYADVDDSRDLMDTAFVTAEGYKFFNNSSKTAEKLAGKLKGETGAKSQLHAHFAFEKIMDTGVEKTGSMGVSVELYVELINDEGDRIYSGYYWEQSNGTIPVVAGLYEPDEMIALFPPVIDRVCQDFAAEFIR